MAAHHDHAAKLQGRRHLGSDCKYQRCGTGDRTCAARTVFRCGNGKDLRQFYRSEKAGTRLKAVYPFRSCKGGDNLRHGANACSVQYRAGYHLNHNDICRIFFGTADNLAAGDGGYH